MKRLGRHILFIFILAFFVHLAAFAEDVAPSYYLDQSKIYVDKGDYDRAESYLKQVLDIDPKNSNAYYALGNVYVKQNLIDNAIASFENAIYYNSSNVNAYLALSKIYYDGNVPDEGNFYLNQAIRLNPSPLDAETNYLLGKTLISHGQSAKAISYLERAVKIRPDYLAAYKELSALYFDKGVTVEKIRQALRKNNLKNPHDPDTYRKIMLLPKSKSYNIKINQNYDNDSISAIYDIAYKYCRKAASLDPKNTAYSNNFVFLGQAYLHNNKKIKALNAFGEAVRINSNNIKAYKYLISTCKSLGNNSMARIYYVKARQIDPNIKF